MADSDNSKSPAFQFYPSDFLSDLNVVAMSLQERGAYITLLCFCWIQGSLPKDPSRLARLCGVPWSTFRKVWPALEPCFREGHVADRLRHPRLDREREKQVVYRQQQSDRGKLGGRPRKAGDKPAVSETQSQTKAGGKQEEKPDKSSSSSVFRLQTSSSDFSQKTDDGVHADARSKRPIFKGQRFVVFDWMLEDLSRMLGSHCEDFDLHAWFYDLDAKAVADGIVVPQRDGGKWLQEQTHTEAVRRGLPIAVPGTHNPKTAGNLAAAARFIARGQR